MNTYKADLTITQHPYEYHSFFPVSADSETEAYIEAVKQVAYDYSESPKEKFLITSDLMNNGKSECNNGDRMICDIQITLEKK